MNEQQKQALNTLIEAVNKGMKEGAFNLQEASVIVQAVGVLSMEPKPVEEPAAEPAKKGK